MMKTTKMVLSLATAVLLVAAVACGNAEEPSDLSGMVDEASEEVQDAAEDVQEAAEDVGYAAEDAAEGMGDAAEEGMEMADEAMDMAQDELAAAEARLAEVQEKIKAMSPQDLMSDSGKKLKAEADSLMAKIKEMKEGM